MGITQDDLRLFHRQYFVPNNMILAIVGDVTGEEAFAQAERVFGSGRAARCRRGSRLIRRRRPAG